MFLGSVKKITHTYPRPFGRCDNAPVSAHEGRTAGVTLRSRDAGFGRRTVHARDAADAQAAYHALKPR